MNNLIFPVLRSAYCIFGFILLCTGTISASKVTFVYHDEEGVIKEGETVYIAGDFNSWDYGAYPLLKNGDGTYSATIEIPDGDIAYKYFVKETGGNFSNWLNNENRGFTISANETKDDYRDIVQGWACLFWPASITTIAGQATTDIYGQLYIHDITDNSLIGRSIKAEVGYGTENEVTSWTHWEDMVYNNVYNGDPARDEFVGTLTPDIAGYYKFTTRFNCNWGANNPNSSWIYGDIDGSPFSFEEAGALTVEIATGLSDDIKYAADLFKLEIFPNPTKDILNIHCYDTEVGSVELLSISGESLQKNYYNSKEISIDLKDFVNGIYILKVISDNGKSIKVQRIIKQ